MQSSKKLQSIKEMKHFQEAGVHLSPLTLRQSSGVPVVVSRRELRTRLLQAQRMDFVQTKEYLFN